MPWFDFSATQGMDDPRMIAVCQNCDKEDCEDGLCEEYIKAFKAIFGKPKRGKIPRLYEIYGVKFDLKTWAIFTGTTSAQVRHAAERHSLYEALGKPTAQEIYDFARKMEAKT